MIKKDNSSLFRSKCSLILLVIAAIHFFLHIFANGHYGMFRDEFYYIECARHLAWGYVDHPPFSIAVLAGWIAVFGDSVQVIRILPALAGVLLIVLAWMTAGEFGGGLFARSLAALSAAASPGYLGATGFYSMNAFDLVFWALAFFVILRIVKTGDEKLWLVLGLVAGLGLLNKISMLFFLFGLVVGLLLTPYRRHFRSKYFWMGGAIAFLFFLPHIGWQIGNGWPTLEFMSNAKRIKISNLTPIQFFAGQVSEISPVNMIIALSGLIFLLFHRSAKPFRVFGWIFLTVYLVLAVQKSKPYYMNPDYFVLMTAGAWSIESFAQRYRMNWIKPMILILVVLFGVVSAPFAVPVLPVEDFIFYQKFLGANPPQQERHAMGVLPQFFADRFGWENMAKTVDSVYNSLTPEQKAECAIYATNYGEAGAINYYGRRWGLPRAISEHNNYFLWGYGRAKGKVVIAIGVRPEDWKTEYESVTLAATVVSPYAMPFENNLPVCVCLGLKQPIEKAWGPPHYI